MLVGEPTLTLESQDWVVRLKTVAGDLVEYHYASESQARFFAAVFRMKPNKMPEPHLRYVAEVPAKKAPRTKRAIPARRRSAASAGRRTATE